MSQLVRFVIEVYSRLLNLYPRRFRDEFAGEMLAVFRNSVIDAAREGISAFVFLCGREFIGLPLYILKEFLHEVQGEAVNMRGTEFAAIQQGSWGGAFWAGLPHLLFAILMGITEWITNPELAAGTGNAIVFLLLAGFIATIYYTWRKTWPAWSASWYGYVGLIVFFFVVPPYQYFNPPIGTFIEAGGYIILVPLSLAALLYWISRRNPIEGLLMVLPLIILCWFPVMEFVPLHIRFWLTIGMFLISALTATTIARLNDIQTAIWMVLGASLMCGLPIAYVRTYWHNIPGGHFSPPTFGEMAELFSVNWLTGAALAIGPILGWGLWNFGKKFGRAGRFSAILVSLGMVITLFGHFSYWWSFSREDYLNALHVSSVYRPNEITSTIMVFSGLIIILSGATWLASLSQGRNRLLSLSLILSPLPLPLVAMFSIYFGYYIAPPGLSFEFALLQEIYKYLIFLLGAAWLVMSAWSITRLYHPSLHEGSV